jgi:fructuronate reductase
VEGLPVVTDPKIISPKAFLDEVVEERLPNPFMPDDPRRIATDTSQKVGIRFGETIKSYLREGRDLSTLVAIPLAIAGWLRYLQGTRDDGTAMEVSPDPLKDELMEKVKEGREREILADESIFGLNLVNTPLFGRIEEYLARLREGAGAARRLLRRELRG